MFFSRGKINLCPKRLYRCLFDFNKDFPGVTEFLQKDLKRYVFPKDVSFEEARVSDLRDSLITVFFNNRAGMGDFYYRCDFRATPLLFSTMYHVVHSSARRYG